MEELEKRVKKIVEACEDKKALDIKVLDVSNQSPIAERFIIASGNSTNQVKGISDGVEEAMEDFISKDFIKEGYRSGRWILLDFNSIVVHIFHREEREFYDLERLWE